MLHIGNWVDIWEPMQNVAADGRISTEGKVRTGQSVACRIVPVSSKELIQGGVMDFGNQLARVYFAEGAISNLTHNAVLKDLATGTYWNVMGEPERYRVLPHWEVLITNANDVPKEIKGAY